MPASAEHPPELAAAEHATIVTIDGLRSLSQRVGAASTDVRLLAAPERASSRSRDAPVVGRGDDRGREQRGVDGAGAADRERPDGTPAGICTIESSESMPLSAFDSTGTPSTGSAVFAAVMPGQVRRAAGAGDDHLRARAPRPRGVLEEQVRRAVRGDDARPRAARRARSSVSAACRIVSQSDCEPMMIADERHPRIMSRANHEWSEPVRAAA